MDIFKNLNIGLKNLLMQKMQQIIIFKEFNLEIFTKYMKNKLKE